MVNLIVSIVVLCKSIGRKLYCFIPIALFIALYELMAMFEVAMVEYAGTLERILVILLVISVFFAWRKGQMSVHGIFIAVGVLALRWSWTPVFDWFQKVMQYPGSDALVLLRQGTMVRSVFDGLIFVLILALQILMLRKLRKI